MKIRFTLRQSLVMIAIVAVLFAMIAFQLKRRREAWAKGDLGICNTQLYQMNFALETYKEKYGQYPPLYVADSNGVPMHSWRVLILPYLGHREIYSQYDFNEPWNGPNNILLQQDIPNSYRCSSIGNGVFTQFFGVARAKDKSQFNRDTPKSILIVELHSKPVHWMSPVDVSQDELKEITGGTIAPEKRSHGGRINFIRNDGTRDHL